MILFRRTSAFSIERMARAGYAARGAIYVIIGVSALEVVFLGTGNATDSHGALTALSGGITGTAMLVVMTLGLVAFSLWRLMQSVFDVDHHEWSPRGVAVRGGMVVSAVVHILLAFFAMTLALGYGTGGEDSPGVAARLIAQPFGRYLLGGVGIAMLGASVALAWKGIRKKFLKYIKFPPNVGTYLSPICTFGLVAHGVVFAIMGIFFVYAAIVIDPEETGGLLDALLWVRRQFYGGFLLAVMAAGLFSFGVYGFIQAIWRRIDASKPASHIDAAQAALKRPWRS